MKAALRVWSMAQDRPDLLAPISGSSLTPTRDIVFVVNPRASNGTAEKEWKKLLPYVRSRLETKYNICESFTSGPCHAIDITREAIRKGATAVIAAGGDGTLHEVVNGFFSAGKYIGNHNKELGFSTALGLLPIGTGSDFARSLGWNNHLFEAVERISRGKRKRIDVGVIDEINKEPHYFINVADIHLTAKAGFYAANYKQFGKLCYVFGALQAFRSHKNEDIRIKVDDGEWEMFPNVTALCLGNAKYFGGGLKVAPNADLSNGVLEVVIFQGFKLYEYVLNLHRLYDGTHVSIPNVHTRRVRSIEVEQLSSSNIFLQSDGEHLGFLPRKFRILPSAIEMIQ